MLLKKLLLNNYKTFYGHQEINLYIPKEVREESKQNIILIGGLNGAGKTTILKAILYVLFGERGISKQEHIRLFSNVVNNTFFEEGGRECSLTLILETDIGEEWELKTKWIFDHNKKLVNESREITTRKPGVKVGRHSHIENIEAFNRFIDQMIPYHAAPFFIFDGEEIKDIIIRQNSSDMKEAIQKISGVEAYKQLISDLNSIKTNLEQRLAKSVNQNKLKTTSIELIEAEKEIEMLENKWDEFITEKKKIESLIGQAKEARNEKIIANSKSRETVIQKQTRYSTEIKLTNEQLRKYFLETTVQIIVAKKLTLLKERIKKENEIMIKKNNHDNALVPYQKFINQLLGSSITPPLSEHQLDQITRVGQEIWIKENNIKGDLNADLELIHDLNTRDLSYLVNLPVADKTSIIKMINRIEELNRMYDQTEFELRNAPDSVDIEGENKSIDLLTKKVGEIELRQRSIRNKLERAKEAKTNLMNQVTRLSDSDEDYTDLTNRYNFIQRIIKAMDEYVSQMTIMKAQFIKEEFASMLLKLFRKQDEFGRIEFDIDTYTIRLYNDRQQEISMQDRSAGEMQMIASSLIWALTKASDLALPMVIDTPLARLDSHHRNQLINHYYKELSDQVIILSTDTEVTEDYINLMKEHSYKQYMLDYDQSKKYTIIRDGYFNFVKV